MEDQQNSERSDHLDEIGSDLAIELAKSMPLYSPLRVPWCTDQSLEFFHFPFDIDTYSSISTMSSPPDFDGVFSDGLHGINTASSIRVTAYLLVVPRVAKFFKFEITERLLDLETLKQLLKKQYRDPAVSLCALRSSTDGKADIWRSFLRSYGEALVDICNQGLGSSLSSPEEVLCTFQLLYLLMRVQVGVLVVAARRLTLESETLEQQFCNFEQQFGKLYKDVAVPMSLGALGTSSDGKTDIWDKFFETSRAADICNKIFGSSLSSRILKIIMKKSLPSHKALQEQNEFLPGSNKSKMEYRSEEDNINVCHGNDPAGNLCGSSNHKESLEARGSPKLTLLADLTTTAYSSFCSPVFTKPQTELPCSDRALKQPMATLPHVVPHVTTMKNAGIVTTLQNEPDNLMTAPCWGSANELEVHPPSLLLPCLTESTAQDNLAQPRSLTHHEARLNGGELTPLTTYGQKIVSTNKSCIVIHHPEKKNTSETQKRKCRTDLGEDQPIEVTEFHNGKKLCSIQYGGGMVQLDPLNQQSMDPTINSGRNGGSGEQRDNVVTHSQEKPKCKHRIQISLEAIQQQRGMSRIDAANCLKVSQSTLKRICRKYGIDDWRKIKKDNHSRPIEFVQGVDQEQILKSSSNVPSMQASAIVAHTKLPETAMQDANMVSIKAKYASDIIMKFELSFPDKLVELQQQVAKRLNLEAGTYYIKYKDEDNDLILIACDDDLERLCTCRLQGSSSIEVFLQPK